MKILHITKDSKFLDHAFPVFEKVYPGSNVIFVFSPQKTLKYVRLTPDYVVTEQGGFIKRPKLSEDTYKTYDLVVFHSLALATFLEIENIPDNIPIIWLGWGFDYYRDWIAPMPQCLDKTQSLYSQLTGSTFKNKVAALLTGLSWVVQGRARKIRAIEKISVFSPVLPEEYGMVKNSRAWRSFPEFALWNYGTLEDNLVKGFECETVTGDAILINNSATYTGNHAEVFDLLCNLTKGDREMVVPLSYGDKKLAEKLHEMGEECFGSYFEPLLNYMPVEDYVQIIKKCGYVIMNHVRQQAVGNIVIMLYLGARVFVRQESPVYSFFKKLGVLLSTVQELEANSELLETPLTHDERTVNRALVVEYWTREEAYKRTRKLVEKALSLKTP